jgi:hypothetical protein
MGMTRRHASRCSRKRPAASRTRIPERQTLSSGSERAQTLEETGRVSAVAGEYEIDHRLSDSAANVHLGIWDNSLDPDSDRERRTDGRNDRCRCGSHGRDETGRSTHDRPLARAAWIASHGGVPPLLDRGRSEDQSSCEPAEVDRFSVSPGEFGFRDSCGKSLSGAVPSSVPASGEPLSVLVSSKRRSQCTKSEFVSVAGLFGAPARLVETIRGGVCNLGR